MPVLADFIPVDPLLDDQGQFVSLANFANLPIKPNPFDGADLGRSEFGREYMVSYSASSKLEVAAVGGVDARFGTTTFVHDSIIYRLSRATIVGGSPLVRGTWWSFGIRLKVYISNVQLGVNIGWANLAASVQLGYADAEFELESIGISDSGLFKLLPVPMDLNMDSFDKILEVGNEFLKLAHTADPEGVIYQPVRIQVDTEDSPADPLSDDKNLIFAYQQVADRQRLKNAKSNAMRMNLDPNLVGKFYKDVFGVQRDDDKPSSDMRDMAQNWLNI